MDDSFFRRVLFEWIRARKKEQARAETIVLKVIVNFEENPHIFQRLSPVLYLRALDHEFTRLKKRIIHEADV